MKRSFLSLLSLAGLALACIPAWGQSVTLPTATDRFGNVVGASATVLVNEDGTPATIGGGGGGGAGTEYTEDAASAANPVAPALQLRRRDVPTTGEVSAEGDWVTAIADSQGQMRVRAKEMEALAGGVYNTTLPTLTDATTNRMQVGTRGSLHIQLLAPDSNVVANFGTTNVDAIAASSIGSRLEVRNYNLLYNGASWDRQRGDTNGAIIQGGSADGAAVAGNPVSVAGTDGTNNRRLRTDARGGLVPAQGVVASTRTTLTASTATAIEAAGVAARTLESIFTEAALAANVYLCTTQTTSCSATVYDFLIPSGAAAGTIFTPPFATTGRLYAYSTGTPVLIVNSWTAP